MVSVASFSLLAPEVLIPSAVGLGAVLVAIIMLPFLMRDRPAPLPPVAEKPKDPEYDPFAKGSASEQRKSFRRRGNPVEVYLRQLGSPSEPRRGEVLNRSTGGVCLAVAEMIAKGTVIEVRPANAPDSVPWVEVEVRDCRRTQDVWELGCKFVQTPPWNLLLMFG